MLSGGRCVSDISMNRTESLVISASEDIMENHGGATPSPHGPLPPGLPGSAQHASAPAHAVHAQGHGQ